MVAQRLKHLPPMRETRVQFLGREDPLEKEMAIHSSILAWRIPWTEEPGGLQSMVLQRVGHDWVTLLTYLLIPCFLEVQKSLPVIFSLRLKRKSFEIFFVLIKIIIYLVSSFITYPTQIFPIFVSDWIPCFPPLLNYKAFALEASCKWLLGVSLGCLQKKKKNSFLINRWENSGNSGWLYFSGLQNHCRWWLQPWN